jgi:murein DD-endopeptidase MepM/ murein hydrolase activator NlpD
MIERTHESHRPRQKQFLVNVTGLIIVGMLAACGGSSGGNKANVEVRGTDPNVGAKRAGSNTLNNAVVAKPDSNGIITYDGYQSVVARSNDTVSAVADRVGLSASELGAYNGLSATHVLRKGDELVLPPRPGGYGPNGPRAAVTAPANASTSTIQAPARTATIEQTPIDGTATAALPSAEPTPAAGTASQTTGWSPDIAAAAIERSTGIQEDGTLAAPPSATEPTPPEPTKRRELDSPNLAQYQTEESTAAAAPTPKPEAGATSATSPSTTTEETQVAAAPAAATLNLVRPVQGPVAIGFNKGAGPSRNDGVDFAAKAGAKVVAAADGQVALVSQSLSGLGTIVLVRHPNEYLTVYGRIDGVLVNKGDNVRRGQQIGIVSNAAAPAEPRMHFEVRRGAESLDPMRFLRS